MNKYKGKVLLVEVDNLISSTIPSSLEIIDKIDAKLFSGCSLKGKKKPVKSQNAYSNSRKYR